MNFLAGLILGQPDEKAHSIMTRYGRGAFDGPAASAEVAGKSLKISASYLYEPVLGQLIAKRCGEDVDVRGSVQSKGDIAEALEEHGLEVLDATKRGGFKFRVSGVLSPGELFALYEDLWDSAILTKLKTRGYSLSPGSSVPKPNKSSDASFCKVTLPLSSDNRDAAFEALIPGESPVAFESLGVTHLFRVEDLVVPAGLQGKPAAQVRLAAGRKGTICRKLVVDGAETEREFEFLA